MILTKGQIEVGMDWGDPKEINTKRGLRLLRKADPTPRSLKFWEENQNELIAAGVNFGFKWKSQTEREFVWWQPIPKELTAAREANQELSRATDAEINIPAPDGKAYLPYQKAGVAFMLGKTGILLGDDMGLGKTIQAIGTINKEEKIRNVLVICPQKLRLNWHKELRAWLVRPFNIEIISSDWSLQEVRFAMDRLMGMGPKELFEKETEQKPGAIFIINYDIAYRYDLLMTFLWDMTILDEAHLLKNPKARRTRAILGYRPTKAEREAGETGSNGIVARKRTALTGTPIPNKIIEIWPILQWLDPVTFNSFWNFTNTYCGGGQGYGGRMETDGASNLPALQNKLRQTVMIRRKKEQVLKELPAKRRQVIPLPAEGPEMKAILARDHEAQEIMANRVAELEAKVVLAKAEEKIDSYKAAIKALGEAGQFDFQEMSKIRHETAVAKIPLITAFAEDLLQNVDKIGILAYHRDVIDALQKAFSGVGALKIYGGMTAQETQRSVDLYQNDPDYRVIIVSIPVAVGMTLTAGSHVIAAEEDWVPGNMSQAEDRWHRIGQVNCVNVYHLVLEGSIDQRIAEVACAKQDIITSALDEIHDAEEKAIEESTPVSAAGHQALKVTRRDITKEAKLITPTQSLAILGALKAIAGMCNYATTWDGAGFSKVDTIVGHSLATQMFLTPRQAALGRKLVNKYRRQLPAELLKLALE